MTEQESATADSNCKTVVLTRGRRERIFADGGEHAYLLP